MDIVMNFRGHVFKEPSQLFLMELEKFDTLSLLFVKSFTSIFFGDILGVSGSLGGVRHPRFPLDPPLNVNSPNIQYETFRNSCFNLFARLK